MLTSFGFPAYRWLWLSNLAGSAGRWALVLVLSSAANASAQVRREVERAGSQDIPILSFRVEDVVPSKALQYFLSEAHWLTAANPPVGADLAKLAQAVERLLARPTG